MRPKRKVRYYDHQGKRREGILIRISHFKDIFGNPCPLYVIKPKYFQPNNKFEFTYIAGEKVIWLKNRKEV